MTDKYSASLPEGNVAEGGNSAPLSDGDVVENGNSAPLYEGGVAAGNNSAPLSEGGVAAGDGGSWPVICSHSKLFPRKLFVFLGSCLDPYENLAVEEYLMENAAAGSVTLYLWQNRHTVVIGRNQNAWKECRTELLEKDGGHLARRLSGGGAVYHDLGNLNFTFLYRASEDEPEKRISVIRLACRMLGIETAVSGRNDITADGRKFSGSAFYKSGDCAYHHGTLLVNADTGLMSRYLRPSEAKLASKGVDSVRARVVNLSELCPSVTVPLLKRRMAEAFSEVYGLAAEEIPESGLDRGPISALASRNRSWVWNYGRRLPFTFSCEDRFAWGGIRMELNVESGVIRKAAVYSDAMDWRAAPEIEKALSGCRFTRDAIRARITASGVSVADDICALIARQNL